MGVERLSSLCFHNRDARVDLLIGHANGARH